MKLIKAQINNKRGFTLIELLVVVAIIGILSSVVLASLNTARAKSRDAARLSAIHQIANALFLSLDANGGNFPSSGGSAVCLGTAGTCWGGAINGSASLMTLLQPFISQIPVDPSRTSGKGDKYLYGDKDSYTTWHCDGSPGANNGDPYPKGPYIFWVPDASSPGRNDADCKNASFMGCCGVIACSPNGYYCAYKIQ